jgi:hypothetical protein
MICILNSVSVLLALLADVLQHKHMVFVSQTVLFSARPPSGNSGKAGCGLVGEVCLWAV